MVYCNHASLHVAVPVPAVESGRRCSAGGWATELRMGRASPPATYVVDTVEIRFVAAVSAFRGDSAR